MPRINAITNPNKLIEKKINYFLDRLNHYVTYVGWQWHLEMESPTSLIEKILFRLTQDTEFRLEYLDNYFKNVFFTADTIWDQYSTFPAVKKVVGAYNLVGNAKNRKGEKIALIDSATFQNNLKQLLQELVHKLPNDLIDGILSITICGHDLNDNVRDRTLTHEDLFRSYALTLVCEYLYRGRTRKEIGEIISNVFSKDIQKFPFPPHLTTRKQKEKHLVESELKNQLHGFSNTLKLTPHKGTIMIKVFGGVFPDSFEFKYNKVKFWAKDHPSILELRQKMPTADLQDFFTDGDYILATTELTWLSQDSLLRQLKNVVRSELFFLSAILDRDFSVDTTNNFVRVTSKMEYKGSAWSSRNFHNVSTAQSLETLNDNGYHVLRKVKGRAVDWFLNCEPLFVNAHKTESISDYWLYMEALLSVNRKDKMVKGLVSSIILSSEKLIRDRRILTTLSNYFTPSSGAMGLLNISSERWRKLHRELRKGRIAKDVRTFTYPFIQELIKEYDSNMDSSYYKNAKDYYYRMLTEAYEYRNFHVHRGRANEKSKIKLIATLPNIVVRMRWAIFKELKKGSHDIPFNVLIDKLFQTGNKLAIPT